jgi:pimeloyl-ACP methyl ester carboxylesterase
MKNIFYKVGLVFFLFAILFSISNKAFAFALPYSIVNVITNSSGGDAEFNYNLELLTPLYSFQQFGIETQNGQGNYSTGTTIYNFNGSSTLYLTQVATSSWKMSDVSCTSTDSRVTTETCDNGLSIGVFPYDTVNCTFNNIFDPTAPIINILGDNPLKISASSTEIYTDPGATASDTIDGDITENISTSSDVDLTTVGTYSVVYTVSDGAGNIASSTRTVEVIEPPKPTCCSNVLFIPGLEGSRLYETDGNGNEEKIWEPGILHDNSVLDLNSDGEPNNPDFYTKDVIDTAYYVGNVYSSFISTMNKMKSAGTINDWAAAPYDWRLSLADILNNGNETSDGKIYYSGDKGSTSSPYIINELRELAASSQTGKVTIVAHSNGGLVTKALTDALGPDASKLIDQIIFVAVPQTGTPSAIGGILHGFNTGIPFDWLPFFFSSEDARELGQNMSSVYNFLPSSQYFNDVSDPVVTFDDSTLLAPWRKKYGSEINSEQSLDNFLEDQSRTDLPVTNPLIFPTSANENLLNNAVALHDSELDNWTPPAGVDLTEIAGWGEDTLKTISYYQGYTSCLLQIGFMPCLFHPIIEPVLQYDPVMTSDGDGTVVVPSALWTDTATTTGKYWVNLGKYNQKYFTNTGLGLFPFAHANILEVTNLLDFIKNIITQSTSSLPLYISTSSPPDTDIAKTLHFILHSPLYLGIYDDEGNFTGFSTTTNQVEENIPGSDYQTFGEVTYISIPASATAHVVMSGYASGSFTLDIQEVQDDNIIASTTFAGIPSSTSTIATIDIPSGGNISSSSPLTIDENGNGNIEFTLSPKIGDVVLPDFFATTTSTTTVASNNNPVVQTVGGGGGFSYPYYLPFSTTTESTSTKVLSLVTEISSSTIKTKISLSTSSPIITPNLTNKNTLSSTTKIVKAKSDNVISTSTILASKNNKQTAVVGNSQINAKLLLVLSTFLIVVILAIKFI